MALCVSAKGVGLFWSKTETVHENVRTLQLIANLHIVKKTINAIK
jgi:hypothetical protein